MRLSNTVLF